MTYNERQQLTSAMIKVMCCTGKDVYWYTREKADQDANEAAELLAVKQREEDLMAEVRLQQCRL